MLPFRRSPWMLFIVPALGLYLGSLFAGLTLPRRFLTAAWWPRGVLALRVDASSWPYALSLSALALAVLLTAPARGARRPLAWGSTLGVLLAGLLAVFSANFLTLALAWALLDAFELTALLLQAATGAERGRVVGVFAARLGGVLLLMWVFVQGGPTGAGASLNFDLVLLLAVAMRLGVFPLHLPFFRESQPLRRGLGTTLRLVSPAASLWLLADVARGGLPAPWLPWLEGGALAAGLVGALGWLTASDALNGRPFWVLGMAALAVGAALNGQSQASLAWGVTMVLCGGLLFLASLRERALVWAPLLAAALLAGLPSTPGWAAAQGYLASRNGLMPLWMMLHFAMTAGYVRFLWPGRPAAPLLTRGERAAYLAGMGVLLGTAFLLGGHPVLRTASSGWLHLAGLAGAALLLWGTRPFWGRLPRLAGMSLRFLLDVFSLDWLYRQLWRGYRLLSFVARRLASLLEGESGLLWMLLLLLVLLAALFPEGGRR